MEKKNKVVSYKNLPTRFPMVTTGVSIMAMDIYNVSGIVWGVVCTLLAIIWIASIVSKYEETQVQLRELKQDKTTLNN